MMEAGVVAGVTHTKKSNILWTFSKIWQHTLTMTATVCKDACNNLWGMNIELDE